MAQPTVTNEQELITVSPNNQLNHDSKEKDLPSVECLSTSTTNDHCLSGPASSWDVLTQTIHLDDDPSLRAITFRSIFIGIGLSAFGGILSGIYYFKPQPIAIPTVFIAIVAFAIGEFMSRVLPRGNFLNPGPFNIKEHLAITIMAGSASTTSIGLDIIAAERLFYGKRANAAVTIFMLLSSQCIGYGMAGLMRRAMVYPAAMLWPVNLPINTMLERLHSRAPADRKTLRVFFIVFAAIFVWEIFPQWVCPLLTGFSIFCLANRTSQTWTNLFGGAGGNEGLGLFSICLDWQYISGGSSPLFLPLDTLISAGIGTLGSAILFAGLYYTDTWNAKQFPLLSQMLFSDSSTISHQVQWNQTAALGPGGKMNMTAVDTLGLPNFAATNLVTFLLSNMTICASIAHLVCWYPSELKAGFRFLVPKHLADNAKSLLHLVGLSSRRARARPDGEEKGQGETFELDPHYALMQNYKDCPDWWYAIVLVLFIVVAFVVTHVANTGLPWWMLLIAFLIGFCLMVVLGVMQGVTGVSFHVQSVMSIIGGFIRPGYPVANMYFSLYSCGAITQGSLLAKDLKLAQYGHLAPRVTFCMQIAGTVVGVVLNYVMSNSIIDSQFDVLRSVESTHVWSGVLSQLFNAQSVAFGGLPHELFGKGGRYAWMPLTAFLGFPLPVVLWLAHRRWPFLRLDQVNSPVLIYNLSWYVLGINSSAMIYFVIGYTSQWYVRRRYPNMFVKYNYLVSAALDGGSSLMLFILSFAVLGAANAAVNFPNYWGNPATGHVDYCY